VVSRRSCFVLRANDAQVELFRRGRRGEADEDRARVFDALHIRKAQVEDAFGAALLWEREGGAHNRRIARQLDVGGYRDPDDGRRSRKR
jgi:hypothetical protein